MEINRLSNLSQIKSTQAPQMKKEVDSAPSDSVQLGSRGVDEGVQKKWLFMNYIGADCNLKEFQAKNIDNQEIVGSDANTHIVAMIDVGPTGKEEKTEETEKAGGESAIDWKGCRTYYVTKDATPDKINSPVIAEHGLNVDTSDPKTLTNFIVDTMKKFPAENVALILNDHGGGWTGAISDDSNGNMLSVPQIKQALADAEKITGKKIDILGFDACLMADAQAAYEFKDVAKYLLASEETESGPGWTYDPMLGDKPKSATETSEKSPFSLIMGGKEGNALKMLQDAMGHKIEVSPEEFCKIVVKVNEQHQGDIPTFSATDLGKMGDLAKATDNLAKAILDTEDKKSVKEAIMKAENYGGGWTPYSDMRDMGHMADLIEKGCSDPKLKEAALEIKKAVGEAVIANEVAYDKHPNSTGLHIYANMDPKGLEENYKDLAFAKDIPSWVDAVETLGKVEVPNQPGGGGYNDGGGDYWGIRNSMLYPDGSPRVWPDGSPRKPSNS